MEAAPRIAEYAGRQVELGRLRTFALRMRVWWAKDPLTRELARGAVSIRRRRMVSAADQGPRLPGGGRTSYGTRADSRSIASRRQRSARSISLKL
jgi:hypothetical protein